jgi:hypothetical protein
VANVPVANVPVPVPVPTGLSTANLRPTRWRGLVVVVGVSLLAVGAAVGVTRHRSVAVAPEAPAAAPVSAPESQLSPVGRRQLRLAQDYAHKFWCSAAIEELVTGLHEAPELRGDPQLTRMMIPCLRAKTQEKTLEFLVTVVGRDARRELESALTEELRPDVREGVQRALARIASRP